MIEIKSYPAKNGDAFLVRASDGSFTMLVDGGYAETFNIHLEPDLKRLAVNGGVLDFVIATHVDADHISGLLPFFRRNGRADAPEIIPVGEVLHNSLRSLVSRLTGHTALRPDDLAILQEIRQLGFPAPAAPHADQEISARQGACLSDLLRKNGYQWNTGDGTRPIGRDGLSSFTFPGGSITILGPNNDRLLALKNWWISELRRTGFVGSVAELDDIFEILCARETAAAASRTISSSDDLSSAHLPDDSVTNGSSISMILEVGRIRILFLGDAWAADVVAELKSHKVSLFAAVKISHHGSARNTSPELLDLIDAAHWFISTDGNGHGHPDFAVLKAIVDRPATFKRTLHFNYSTPASVRLRSYRSASGAEFSVEEGNPGWIKLPEDPQS